MISRDLTADAFNQLLDWLGQDRDAAAKRYEQIRSRLITVFQCRGCAASEELADRTIDRVAIKLDQILAGYEGDPALYFYGVAEKVYLEYIRQRPIATPPFPDIPALEIELKCQCLETCMEGLSPHNRTLILAYYGSDLEGKIEARKKLARRLGLGANALCLRAHRIREALRKCVSTCFRRAQLSDGSNSRKGTV